MPPSPPSTRDDHVRYGWNGEWFRDPDPGAQAPSFAVAFGRCQNEAPSWRDACIDAARRIGETAREKIVVCCSAGWDSEVVVRSFVAAGVPIEVAIMEFEHGLNRHDVAAAHRLCDELRIPKQVIPFELLPFVESGLQAYADAYQLTMPAMTPQIWLAERVEGAPVFGGGDLHLQRDPYRAETFVELRPHSMSIDRALRKIGKEGYAYFFFYTPEQTLAYLEHPLTKTFVKTSFSMRITNLKRFRHPTYAWSFPELRVQRQNANGWELVRPLYEKTKTALDARWGRFDVPCRRSIRDLVAELAADPEVALRGFIDPEIDPDQADPDVFKMKDI